MKFEAKENYVNFHATNGYVTFEAKENDDVNFHAKNVNVKFEAKENYDVNFHAKIFA